MILLALTLTACNTVRPPAFPDATTAALAGPSCQGSGQACRCALSSSDVGTPPPGLRRYEVRLPSTQGTASAVVIDGVGALVRDQGNPDGSCFYVDLRPGATYRVQYMAQAQSRERGISVSFSMKELGPEGNWYDVIQQICGSNDEPCGYESVSDWTEAVSGGHRFHDPCSSSLVEGIRVDGGLYDRRFIDAQFTFGLRLHEQPPTQPPGSVCRRDPEGNPIEPDVPPEDDDGDDADAEESDPETVSEGE